MMTIARMTNKPKQRIGSREQFNIAPIPFPIQEASSLLSNSKYKRILTQLEKIAHVPEEYYKVLYADTINAFAEFVQELPASHVTGYNHQGGLLELGLERALQALAHYRKEYPIKTTKPEDMPRQLALYTYALFTAGLFYGIGQIVATYIVYVCDRRGRKSEPWVPVTGPMTLSQQTHYRYAFDSVNRDPLAARSSTVIAQCLMPSLGFEWIASDRNVFDYWLAILQNDERHGGLFAKIILSVQRDLINQAALRAQAMVSTHHISDEVAPPAEGEQANADKQATEKTENVDIKQREAVGHHLEIPGISPGAEITAEMIIGSQGGELMQQLFLNWLYRMAIFRNPYFLASVIMNNQGAFIRGSELIQQFMLDNNITADLTTVVRALQRSETLLVVRNKQGETQFVVKDITQIMPGKTLPPVHKSVNVANISSQQKTYPELPKSTQKNTLGPSPKSRN